MLRPVQSVIWRSAARISTRPTQAPTRCFSATPSTMVKFKRGSPAILCPKCLPVLPATNSCRINWDFERQILEHVLIPRYGFTPIPLENHDCAQRLALANAYPAKVSRRCEALDLPFREDKDARDAMRRVSR